MTMKRDKLIIILFSLVLGIIFIRSGSSMDFLSQHIVFPNYLRELFYSSFKIIPSFMMHIGAGENIFNIAYYGLLNPIIVRKKDNNRYEKFVDIAKDILRVYFI